MLYGTTHEQTIICGKLFAGHVVDLQPKNRMENGIELYVSLIVVRANKPQTNCSQSQEDLLYALDCFLIFAC